MKKILFFFSVCAAILCLALFDRSKSETHSIFYISGENLYKIVKCDASFNIILAFLILEHIPAVKNEITTGEYEITKGENVISVITKMLSRKRIFRKLMIPEGYTVKRILEVINDNKLLFGTISKEYEEASLAPNTYFYSFGDSKDSILIKMHNQMKTVIEKYKLLNKTSLSFNEILILASIIEKESGNKNELSFISSVFHNRLAIKMRLQSDPTVIYAISNGYGKIARKLTRKDLWYQSPFNTYRNAGLPPTPICCPGENAIKAALNPANTNFYYFVATKQRTGHIFSKNYKQHLLTIKKQKCKE